MTSMKTPNQIANDMVNLRGRSSALLRDIPDRHKAAVADAIIAAIDRDRAQRDIYTLIAEALEERSDCLHDDEYPEATERRRRAARAIHLEQTDTLWCDHIGPMLDAIEEDLGLDTRYRM